MTKMIMVDLHTWAGRVMKQEQKFCFHLVLGRKWESILRHDFFPSRCSFCWESIAWSILSPNWCWNQNPKKKRQNVFPIHWNDTSNSEMFFLCHRISSGFRARYAKETSSIDKFSQITKLWEKWAVPCDHNFESALSWSTFVHTSQAVWEEISRGWGCHLRYRWDERVCVIHFSSIQAMLKRITRRSRLSFSFQLQMEDWRKSTWLLWFLHPFQGLDLSEGINFVLSLERKVQNLLFQQNQWVLCTVY